MTNPFFADTTFTTTAHDELDLGRAFEEEFQSEEFEPVTPPLAAGWLLCEPACDTDPAFEYLHKLDGFDGASLSQLLTLYRRKGGKWSAKVRLECLVEPDSTPAESTHYDSAPLALKAGISLAEGQLSDYKRSRAARAKAIFDNPELKTRLIAETVQAHLRVWAEAGLPPVFKFDAAYLHDACLLNGIEREPLFGISLVEQGAQRLSMPVAKLVHARFAEIGRGKKYCLYLGQLVEVRMGTDWALTSEVDDAGICDEKLEYSRVLGDKAAVQTLTLQLGCDSAGYTVVTKTLPAADRPGVQLTPEKGLQAQHGVSHVLAEALKAGLKTADEQARFFYQLDSTRTSSPLATQSLPGNGSAVFHKGELVIASLYGGALSARAVTGTSANLYLRFSDIQDNDVTERVSRATGRVLTKNGLRVEKQDAWALLQMPGLLEVAQECLAAAKARKTLASGRAL